MLTEMRGSSFALILGSVALAAGACSVYDSSLLQLGPGVGKAGNSGSGGGSGNAGTDGGGGGNSGSGPLCNGAPEATFPPPPTNVPASNKDLEVVAAQYTIDLGDQAQAGSTHYRDIGFDLDQKCTTQSALKTTSTCSLPPYDPGVLDGPGGIDNALGELIQFVRSDISDFSSDHYTQSLQNGTSNVILRLQHWNGEANDDQVTVSTMVAAPFDSLLSTKGTKPGWDGFDVWPIADDSVKGSVDKPKFVDPLAYVSNYQLVAGLTNAGLRIDVELSSVQSIKIDLLLSSAVVVCTIVPVEEGKWGYTFSRCTLAGRWAANNLVQQLGQYPNPLTKNGDPLCRGTKTYDAFKKDICGLVDLRVSTTGTVTQPCDALSMGVTYTTKPALLGNLYPLTKPKNPCPDPQLDPQYDCCESLEVDGGDITRCPNPPPDAGAGTGGAPSTGGASNTGGTAGTGGKDASADGSRDASKG